MAHSATRAVQGFEKLRTVADSEVVYLPGDPGVTFARGDMVTMSAGVAILATDSAADAVGRVVKSTVCPAATSATFPISGPGGQLSDLNGANAKALIPVEVDLPMGVKVFLATISGHKDDTVASTNAATRSIGLTTGLGTDDYGNGAFIYIYEGTGKGQWNVIETYDHTGGNVELEVITHRWWEVAPSTDSKVIMLTSAAAANDGRSVFGRFDLDDEDAIDVSDGYDDGNWQMYGDPMQICQYLQNNLAIPVIRSVHNIVAPNG